MKIIIKIYLVLLLSILLVACSSPAIHVQFTSSSFINPDFKNRALPVLIRIYQLSQSDAFNEGTFHQLWRNDEQILGSTLIKRQELMVNPNSTTTIKLIPDKNAHYIGVIALYRNPKHSQWRLIKEMPGSIAAVFSHIYVKISGNTLSFITYAQDK